MQHKSGHEQYRKEAPEGYYTLDDLAHTLHLSIKNDAIRVAIKKGFGDLGSILIPINGAGRPKRAYNQEIFEYISAAYPNGKKAFEKTALNASPTRPGFLDLLDELVPGNNPSPNPVEIDHIADSQTEISNMCDRIKGILIDKNRKYGNSALEPSRVFSQASPDEQLRVRIDDKISRITSGQADDTEDTITDLIGYLILLLICNKGIE